MSQSIPSKMWYVNRSWAEGDDLAYMYQVDGPVKAFESRNQTGMNPYWSQRQRGIYMTLGKWEESDGE